MNQIITAASIRDFAAHLIEEERAPGTVDKYLRDIRSFARFTAGRLVDRTVTAAWKAHLADCGYAPASINSMLAALHSFFSYLGWTGCNVRYLKVQQRLFRAPERDLSRQDYEKLLETARSQGKYRLSLLMETICSTGIRVSEIRYLTVETLRYGRIEIALKGKIRTVLLPSKLIGKLKKYAAKEKIASGEIFLTESGKPMDRRRIWAEMKALCARAGVAATKVFPHNLRHLFAATYYRATRDMATLADLLGHSSLNTTRIYLLSTGTEHLRCLERLGLVT